MFSTSLAGLSISLADAVPADLGQTGAEIWVWGFGFSVFQGFRVSGLGFRFKGFASFGCRVLNRLYRAQRLAWSFLQEFTVYIVIMIIMMMIIVIIIIISSSSIISIIIIIIIIVYWLS